MFLCDENEVPMVRDLGFGVAPGDHALVGVKLSQVGLTIVTYLDRIILKIGCHY